MLAQYFTIKNNGMHEIVIDKSRFICRVARVETENEANAFIQKMKKKYHDATHNCSAYLIGETNSLQKANDDGEPSGTAGLPMLEVLKKKELKNVVAVVTRYFGGVKLGAGGLIRAYSKAVSETCQSIGIVERKLATVFSFQVDYSLLSKTENFLAQKGYQIADKRFTDRVSLFVYVDYDQTEHFKKQLTEFSNGKIFCYEHEKKYRETSI